MHNLCHADAQSDFVEFLAKKDEKSAKRKANEPAKGGTTKGFMISGKFGIVVKCGYAVFSCPFGGGLNSPMQFHTMRMRWTL